ncbi:MAG: hypothetical protein J1F35_03310 [Erysipelotrichales bacterium]|nr:hypothetical protein [Erysipelotrichales bacterium]
MAKNKHIDCKIYSLDYLISEELSETDIYNLFETNSLIYSIIIEQFRRIGDNRQAWKIIKECKENEKWMYQYHFRSKKERKTFEEQVVKIFQNLYQYKENRAEQEAGWFMFYYGFSVYMKGNFED